MKAIIESLQVFIDWLFDCFLWLMDLPGKIIVYLFDLWCWITTELLSISCTYILDGLSYLARLGGYSMEKPTEQLHYLYQILNCILPMNEIVLLAIFLLQSYLLCKMFGLMWLSGLKYLVPRNPFGDK